MPPENDDLHGNAPEQSDTVLLLIDLISDFEFPDGEVLLEKVLPIVPNVVVLKQRARAAGVPMVYVNDNWGRWRSDLRELVRHCLEGGVRGQPVVERLRPAEDDYFVLKPKHSGFFATTLETLLEHLGARRLVLAGTTGEQCVLFTASDAYMRDFELVVPPDCVASKDAEHNRAALHTMERLFDARLTPSAEIRFDGAGDAE